MLKKIKLSLLGIVFLVSVTIPSIIVFLSLDPNTASAAPTAVSTLAQVYGLTPDASGKVPNLQDNYEARWVHAGLLILSFKNKPGVTLNVIPASNGVDNMKGLMGQRNGWANDLEEHYVVEGWPTNCYNVILLKPSDGDMVNGKVSKIDIDIDFSANANGGCINSGGKVTIDAKDSQYSTSYFRWLDSAQIETIQNLDINIHPDDNGTSSFQQLPTLYKQDPTNTNVYIAANEANQTCLDRILVDKAANTMKFYLLSANGVLSNGVGYSEQKDSSQTAEIGVPGCQIVDFRENFANQSLKADHYVRVPPQSDHTYTLANPLGAGKDANTVEPSTGNTGAIDPDGEEEPSCETSGVTLSWITCGVINALAGFTRIVFEKIIEPYLVVLPINTDPTNNPLFTTWSAMRNIANIILLFALLFIVFGQVIGGGLVDAYTAKKALPRILVAAILINLSLYAVAALVDLFNVLGRAIGDLIVKPFRQSTLASYDTNGGSNAVGAILAAIGVAILVAIIAVTKTKNVGDTTTGIFMPALHFFAIFVLVPAVLVMLAVFVTLIIRRGLIMILVVTAPVAFALFALPSTEKYFKKWWGALITTLMIYPIITVLFAVSGILAALSFNGGSEIESPLSSFISAAVAMIILLAPLMMIPFSFKLAGGIIGNLMNTVKGMGDKADGIGKNRHKEIKSLQRKANFDNPSSGIRRRMATREKIWKKQGEFFKRAGTNSKNLATGQPLVRAPVPATPDAVAAGDAAAAEATSRNLPPVVAERAKAAAIAAHSELSRAGTMSPEAVNVGARAAGTAAASGASTQASAVAGRAGSSIYESARASHHPNDAAAIGGAAGAAAAHVYDRSASTNDHATAESHAVLGAHAGGSAFEHAINSNMGSEASTTAAMAAAEARARSDPARPINDIAALAIGMNAATEHQTNVGANQGSAEARDNALSHTRTTY